uniref:Metalloendopeptidase n=1 Tax=Periophthalmus magnuspinnatus TaxID=409849 RepID=A0A3B4B362_9GOBI
MILSFQSLPRAPTFDHRWWECYAMLLRSCLWPKGANGLVTIRFTISSGFAARVCFVSHKSQYDYISIENQRGCYSALGRQGGRQGLSLNRQGYSDRDSYITINWNNMNQQMAYNYFLKSTNYLNTPYDYFPIMQYERTTTTPTTPSFPNQGIPINQRQGLSFWDVHSINLLYNCSNN